MNKHVALIAGITGAVGSALARELSSRDEWIVFGLSRNPPSSPINGVEYRQIDLNDWDGSREALAEINEVTHLSTAEEQPMRNRFSKMQTIT